MANLPNTYVPDLGGKDWAAHGAREIEDALRRLQLAYNTIIARLAEAGIDLNNPTAAVAFYQEVAKGDGPIVEQRSRLAFEGASVTVEDVGDKTVVTVGSVPTGGTSSVVDPPAAYVPPIEIYALRDVMAKNYR